MRAKNAPGKAKAAPQKPAKRAKPAPANVPTSRTVDYTTAGGKKTTKELYDPHNSKPQYIERNLEMIEGKRWARRPSALAKKAGQRSASDVLEADEFVGSKDSWATTECMPEEDKLEDCGWLPGPVVRELPKFKGPKPGPTDSTLKPNSSSREFVLTQITSEFKKKWITYTIAHARAYRAERPRWRNSCIERSVVIDGHKHKTLTEDMFDIWIAAKVRVAQLKTEIPARADAMAGRAADHLVRQLLLWLARRLARSRRAWRQRVVQCVGT